MTNLTRIYRRHPVELAIGTILIVVGAYSTLGPVERFAQQLGALFLTLGAVQLSWVATTVASEEDAKELLRPRLDSLCSRLGTVSAQMRETVTGLLQNRVEPLVGTALMAQTVNNLAGVVNDLQLLTGNRFDPNEVLATISEIDRCGRRLAEATATTSPSPESSQATNPKVAETLDELRSLVLQVKTNVKSLEQPVRMPSSEEVACPSCGAKNRVPLGAESGDSAMSTCAGCGDRFHIHRGAGGAILTRTWGSASPDLWPVREITCPQCHQTTFRPRARPGTKPKTRYCLNCYSLVLLDPESPVVLPSEPPLRAEVVGRAGIDNKSLLECPECKVRSFAFARKEDQVYGVCDDCGRLLFGPLAAGEHSQEQAG